MIHNWTYIQQNLFNWSMQGYTNTAVLGVLFWPLIFTSIIGYVYLKQQSFTAAAVATLILFAAFGNAVMDVAPFVNLMLILVSLAVTAVVLVFLTRMRR